MNQQLRNRHSLIIIASIALLLCLALLAMAFGAGTYGFREVLAYLSPKATVPPDPELLVILRDLRLPRLLAALMIGSGLAVSATLLQTITLNPLAEPGLLGVNAGGVLGLVIGLSFFGAESVQSYMVWAGCGAFLANLLVLSVGGLAKRSSPPHLILIGIATGATLSGIANYILMAKNTALEQFRFWNLGSLAGVKMTSVVATLPYFLGSALVIIGIKRFLAVMQLGDEQARAMGVPTGAIKCTVWIVTAALTAASLALAGPIMFAGFLGASIARLIAPNFFGLQLLYSWLFGMILVLSSDICARWVVRPFEVPIAVVIALIGAPLMIAMARSASFRRAMISDSHL